MSGGGILWGSLCVWYGVYVPSTIPFGYTVITILNFLYFYFSKNFVLVRFNQIAISLLLPFMLQWSLGGFVSSGAVMLWALFALFGSFSFSGSRFVVRMLIAYVVLTVISGILDSRVKPYGASVPEAISVLFFVMNISVISAIVFGMTYFLVHERGAKMRLERLDRIRSEFLSTVSHELRTPLTSILGFNHVNASRMDKVILPALRGDARVEKAANQVRQNLEIVLKEGQRLTALINDILDLSKMEAGVIEWTRSPVSVRSVLEHSIAATEGLFNERPAVALRAEIPVETGHVMGNQDRLVQVFINLISNAVKFTDQGTVTITSRNVDSGGPGIEICVADSGVGLGPEDLAIIFEKFQQAGNSGKGRAGGTGLGLPICRKIVESHGGRIWAESRPGKGGRFFVSLPILPGVIRPEASPAGPAGPIDQAVNRVVLVAEDDPSFRELLRQTLADMGCVVIEATGGRQAFDMAARAHPALIIVDVVMPGMSGFELVRALKGNKETADIPVIMLSILEDDGRATLAGADRYFTKPIGMNGLAEEVRAMLAGSKEVRGV